MGFLLSVGYLTMQQHEVKTKVEKWTTSMDPPPLYLISVERFEARVSDNWDRRIYVEIYASPYGKVSSLVLHPVRTSSSATICSVEVNSIAITSYRRREWSCLLSYGLMELRLPFIVRLKRNHAIDDSRASLHPAANDKDHPSSRGRRM